MATEEPSVIAAASYGAKLISMNSVGFRASSFYNIMRGQIFFKNLKTDNPEIILEHSKDQLIQYANENLCKKMKERGGGV